MKRVAKKYFFRSRPLYIPHGSDETFSLVVFVKATCSVLNPHGSDETRDILISNNRLIVKFLTHTVQMKL